MVSSSTPTPTPLPPFLLIMAHRTSLHEHIQIIEVYAEYAAMTSKEDFSMIRKTAPFTFGPHYLGPETGIRLFSSVGAWKPLQRV